MALKKEQVVLHTGDVITIHEKTIVSDLKLQGRQKIEMWDLYEVCMDEASLNILKNTPSNKEDAKSLSEALLRINYPKKTEEEVEASKKEETSMNGQPENTDGPQK